MAREPQEIKKEIGQSYISNASVQEAYNIAEDAVFDDEFSTASFESIVFGIIAVAVWALEKLFDIHSSKVDVAIYENKPGTARWYRNMALAFQFGFNLLTDDDQFDNAGMTTEQIEASKIIKYCSVKESNESSRVIVKIASESAGSLIPLTLTQINSFKAYMSEIAYAGVKLNIVNNPADKLLLTMRIYRNPLVIDETGNNILTGGKLVEDAVENYIKNLPFDGELVINDLIEHLRNVPGVENAHIISAASNYKDLVLDEYTDFVNIDVKTIPVAGYFEIENFDNITYVV